MFQGELVSSSRILYTPSLFARNTLLYLQETGTLSAKKKHTSTREGLSSYLFFIVLSGSGTLVYNDITYQLNKGDCVFIDCNKKYSQCSSSKQLWSLSWVHFNSKSMKSIYEKYQERSTKPFFHVHDLIKYEELLSSLYFLANSRDYVRDMSINTSLSTLLTYIMKDCWAYDNSNINNSNKNIENVRLFIEEHYKEKISLDNLANRFFINKFYLARIFKKQFGISIMTFINQKRIDASKQMLRFSAHSIDAIAIQCGFQSSSYFSKVFKKTEGISPNRFRNSWKVNSKKQK